MDVKSPLVEGFKLFEKGIILVVTCSMAVVLTLVTVDLLWVIGKDIMNKGFLLEIDQLLEIFGLFMLVLIGVELFESVFKIYQQREHALRVEMVMSVALVAVARKVIILDWKEASHMNVFAAAAVIIALSVGFYLLRRTQGEKITIYNTDEITNQSSLSTKE